jgi:hypothetical protein
LEGDGAQTPINADAATPPSIQSTWFIALVVAFIRKVSISTREPSGTTHTEGSEDGEIATGTDSDLPDLDQEQNGNSGKIGPVAVKTGGRRRKAARKR